MRNFFYFSWTFLFVLITIVSFAKDDKIDSLKILFHSAKQDTDKLNILFQLVENIYDHRQWQPYNDQAHKIAEKLSRDNNEKIRKKGKRSLADAINNIGYLYMEQGKFSEALEYHEKSLMLMKELEDKQGIANSFNNLAYTYEQQGQISKALEYYHHSLKIREEIGDKRGTSLSLSNIASMQYNQDQFSEALDYFQQSLKIRKEINDKEGYARVLNNIASIFYRQNQIPQALEYYEQCLKIHEEMNSKSGVAVIFHNIGAIFQQQENFPAALEYYNKSLKLKEEINDRSGLANTLRNIGHIFMTQNNYHKAEEYLLRSLSMANEIGFPENIRNAANQLNILYRKQKKWEKALQMYDLYIVMRDSIQNEETRKISIQKQMQHEFDKKEATIKAGHEKQTAVETAKRRKQQTIIWLIAAIAVAISAIAIITLRNLRVTNRQKHIIEKQKKTVDEKNKDVLDSIRYAKRIQEAILPPQKLVKQYLEQSFILYKPKDIVAGDFYWVSPTTPQSGDKPNAQAGSIVPGQLPPLIADGGAFLFACCDCTGHGVPGAFMSILGYNGLNRCIKEFGLTKPAAILDKLCELVDEAFSKSETDIKDGMDIALCSLELPTPERVLNPFGVIQYAGAGNSLYHIRKGILTEYSADKQPVGKFAYRKPFTNHEIQLQKDDAIYIFTDGYADQFGGPKGKKFKYKKFEERLLSIQNKTMTEQREILNNTIDEWRGELEQIDDICIVGVKI